MNIKVMVILMILVALLAGVLIVRRGADSKHSVAQRAEKNHLLNYEPADVQKLEIDFIDTLYVLENHDGKWVVTQPLDNVLADTGYVGNIARILTQLVVLDSIPLDSINLLQVGLDNPIATFSVFLTDGEKQSVSFGAFNPSTDYIYALRQGSETVSLLDTKSGPPLLTTRFMVQGRGLITIEPLNVVSVELDKQGKKAVAAGLHNDSGRWYFDYPEVVLPVNKAYVLDILREFYSPQVRKLIDQAGISDRASGLDKPSFQFSATGLDGQTQTIEFGAPVKEMDFLIWARSSLYPGKLAQVDTRLIDRLDKFIPQVLESRGISFLDREGLKSIELRYPHEKIVLETRDDTHWTLSEPIKAPAKLWQVEKLLTHVDTIDASRLLDKAPDKSRGFDQPQLELTINSTRGTECRLLIGNYKSDSVYVRDVLRGLDFLAVAGHVKNLTYSVDDLKDVPLRHVVQ